MITKNIYLLDPYNDVIKVIAVQDSVFRLNINNSIIYTQQEIWDKIDAVLPLNEYEDNITRILRWAVLIQNNVTNLRTNKINISNLIQWYNSYSDNECGTISYIIWNLLYHYIGINSQGTSGGDVNGAHAWNVFTNGSCDNINKIPFYKGKYIGANFDELKSDGTLYYEPLKKGWPAHVTKTNYTSYVTNGSVYGAEQEVQYISTVNNVYMKMPQGSSFIAPVKSINVPKTENGIDIGRYANLIITMPTGVTGSVEMPFNLLQITGDGVVTVDGVQYTLPTDNTTLKAVLQTTQYTVEKWHHSFTIVSNTAGLVAEFLLNYTNIKLFHNNVISYEIISGEISLQRSTTTTPVPTHGLSVNMKDSGSWTLDYNIFFTKNKSIKVPTQSVSGWGIRCVDFLPNSSGKFGIRQMFMNYTSNSLTIINPGLAVIDQCFASRLIPRDETFTTALELSFVSVDESNCYYTLDGTTPDATKNLYTVPFTIAVTTTVKWINIKPDYANSHVNTRVITKTA